MGKAMRALMLAAALTATAAPALAAPAPAVFREEIARTDLGNGMEAVLGRSGMGIGGDSGRHTHPGVEMVTLVEGTVELIIDGQPTRTVQTGEAFMVPNKVIHRIRNVGAGPARFAPVWIIEKGQPIAIPAN